MLEIKNLNVVIGKRNILKNINFSLKPHTITVVVGKNGCGKSTLVSCINQMRNYTGEILFSGNSIALLPIKEKAKLISVLPQILKSPHIKVEDLVRMGRNPYVDIGHHLTKADEEAVINGLEIVGLEDMRECFVDELSGGQRQKAYLAMILAQNTRVLVLDEPTTYMDMSYETTFLNQIRDLKARHKKTILLVMHNLNYALEYADRLLVMDEGEIIFDGTKEECLAQNVIEHTFNVVRYDIEDKVFFR